MAGIHSGLLANATPLSASQEAELEARAIADGQGLCLFKCKGSNMLYSPQRARAY